MMEPGVPHTIWFLQGILLTCRRGLTQHSTLSCTASILFLPKVCLQGSPWESALLRPSRTSLQHLHYLFGGNNFLSVLITESSINALAFVFSVPNPRKIFHATFCYSNPTYQVLLFVVWPTTSFKKI